ncbi:hypothetical protein Pen01_78500 [Phytomonospora endophytica]|nr:hypothetical protein Pen01_78500 [Phytomonospora endophytica]
MIGPGGIGADRLSRAQARLLERAGTVPGCPPVLVRFGLGCARWRVRLLWWGWVRVRLLRWDGCASGTPASETTTPPGRLPL